MQNPQRCYLFPDFPAGKTGGESERCGFQSQVLKDNGYIDSFAPGKHELRYGSIGFSQLEMIDGNDIIQRRIKSYGINHGYLFANRTIEQVDGQRLFLCRTVMHQLDQNVDAVVVGCDDIVSQKKIDRDAKAVYYLDQLVQSQTAFSSFDLSDISGGDPDLFRQLFLGEIQSQTLFPDSLS